MRECGEDVVLKSKGKNKTLLDKKWFGISCAFRALNVLQFLGGM